MDAGSLILLLLILVMIPAIICLFVYSVRYKRVPPDQAMVVFGTKHKAGVEVVKGGGRFIWPVVEEVDYIPLSVRTLDISVESVVTRQGVMLDLDAVAQVKISSDERLLKTVAEQLLSKGTDELNYIAQRSLEGHVREVCARLTVEEINSDRNKVAAEVQNSVGNDLASMGLEVVSFTIRDLRDQVGYLHSLGMKRTAEVKRDAVIGEAQARREGKTAEAMAETAIAEVIRDKNIKIADYEMAVKRKEAERDREILKHQILAFWDASLFFERFETAGKSLLALEKALQEMNRYLLDDRKKGVLDILSEAGMTGDELLVVNEILRTPGSEGEARFQEKVKELKTWLQDMERQKKAKIEDVQSWSDPFSKPGDHNHVTST